MPQLHDEGPRSTMTLRRRLYWRLYRLRSSARLSRAIQAIYEMRYAALADPEKLIWIDPTDVHLYLGRPRAPFARNDLARAMKLLPVPVMGGAWDRWVRHVPMPPKYSGFLEHFRDGRPWEQTSLFRDYYAHVIAEGRSVLGFRNLEDLARYYEKRVDALFAAIRQQGFRTHDDAGRSLDPAHVYIGRTGQIIWGTSGTHRLAIARVLEMDRMPVRVAIRHTAWQRIRELARRGVDMSAHPSHPDLGDIIGSACMGPYAARGQ